MTRVLLIVDDWPDVARSVRRCLKGGFDVVHVASTPEEAEQILSQAAPPPTHLLCDCVLGENAPLGTELIPRWRKMFPWLQRAALGTGSELAEVVPVAGIDAVFKKPFDMDALRAFFGVPSPVAG